MHSPNDTPAAARDALSAIPADLPRAEWVRIGMAAKAAGLGLEDFDSWSATAPDQYNARDTRDVWKSFKGTGIGPGTLFHAARAHGWHEQQHEGQPRPPEPPRPAEPPPRPTHPGPLAVWGRCPPAPADHPYIVSKGGTPEGLRVVPAADPLTIAGQRMAGALVIPAYDPAGNLQTLQFIPPPGTGKKLNLPGATLGGAAFTLGAIERGRPCYLVEGIGQAWACHAATGEAAVACLGWGNVRTIARALAPAGPALVVVPDVGKETQAADLAREVGAAVAYLPAGEAANFDVNDLAHREGLEALRQLLKAQAQGVSPLKVVSLEDFTSVRAQPTAYVIDPFIPRGFVTLLGGHGEIGKSMLGLILAAHVAAGREWAGLGVARGRALYLSLEDAGEVALFRLQRIAEGYALDPAMLVANLTVIDGSDAGPLAQEVSERGVRVLEETSIAEQIQNMAAGYDLVVIDNASDAYDGDENSRRQVRSFLKGLGRWVKGTSGAVLLLVHIDKAAARHGASGNTYSGSTAWHNSARSRLALTRNDREDAIELNHEKLNVGRKLERPLSLEWTERGVLVPVSAAARQAAQALADAAWDRDVYSALHAANITGTVVPTATTGPATAWHVLTTFPEIPSPLKTRAGKPQLEATLLRLQRQGLIQREVYRRDSKLREKWALR